MKKLVALMIPLPLLVGLVAACSSEDPAQPPDASVDVTPDKKPIGNDVVAPDAGSGCVPGDVSTFKPEWKLPNDPQPTACSDTQINDYYSKCFDSVTSKTTDCSAWQKPAPNVTCAKCMVSLETAAKYAALISSDGVTTANIGGCIALKDGDKTDQGCGAKYLASFQCARAACADNCPIPAGDNAAFTAYTKCTAAAAKTVCKTYEAAKCKSTDAGDAIDYCLNSPKGFEDFFKSIGAVFCGGYVVTDAGTDAASDAGPADASPADAADGGG